MYDLIIIGSGPSGLAAALTAKRKGIDYIVIERGVIANTLYHYPIGRPLFSTSNEVELVPGGLPSDTKPTREDVLTHYTNVIATEQINIHINEEVQHISRNERGFLIETDKDVYKTRKVLVAIGGFGNQRRLDVPGEDSSRVSYGFSEAHPFALKSVLVVGGGNSAAEASLFLAEAGARVTLSLRRPSLDIDTREAVSTGGIQRAKIKPWVLEPLERAASEGQIKILTSSEVIEILPRSVLLSIERDGRKEKIEIPCDHVFALIGADPDTRLLEDAGAEIAPDGRPAYNAETYETTVSGLYVAGHITREPHMKSAKQVAKHAVQAIAASLSDGPISNL